MAKILGMAEFTQCIDSIFNNAISMKKPHDSIIERYNTDIDSELNSKTAKGRNRYSLYMKGFCFGYYLSQANRLLNRMEFIYILDGVYYSTCKTTKHHSTKELYNAGRGLELSNTEGNFYYPDSKVVYF